MRTIPRLLALTALLLALGCSPAGPVEVAPSDRVTDLDRAGYDAFLAEGGLVVVDFWAAWCGPCRRMAPIFNAVAESETGGVRFAKVDVDAAGEIAQRYGIRSIPTLLVLRDGEVVERLVGLTSEASLRRTIEKHRQS